MSFSSWPPLERSREKLLATGARALSDAELLAVFLRTGMQGKTALELARDLLVTYGSLSDLVSANLKDLCAQPGLGVAKATSLAAMKEFSQRQLLERLKARDILTSSAATRDYLRARFKSCESEVFSCLFLNNQHHVMELEELFHGTIDGAAVYPREVVKRCLYHNAAAVIFAHNHPSGIAEPSQAGIAITRKLKSAMQTIEVRVLDHLVIGVDEVVSFAERGLL
jgi:DNA repair protein RadC